MRARNCCVVPGCFHGAEIDPGTFHGGKIEGGTFHRPVLPPLPLRPAPVPRALPPGRLIAAARDASASFNSGPCPPPPAPKAGGCRACSCAAAALESF
jgi:hypothetical protein